jgi:DinB superfamily
MNAKDAILHTYTMGDNILSSYLGDLGDAELLVRPVPGMNHIAWQLGHIIAGERWMVEGIKPGSSPALPEGFDEGHGQTASNVDDPSKYYSKDRYQKLLKAQREATKQVLEGLSDADLDAPGPESFRSYAPTVGAVMMMVGTHLLMHVGQFVSVRRKLGKPVTI